MRTAEKQESMIHTQGGKGRRQKMLVIASRCGIQQTKPSK